MKLFYVSNQRFPSERAHAEQIVAMCNAFASCDMDVELLVTNRRTSIDISPEEYYGRPLNFAVKKLNVPNFVGLGSILFMLQRLIFAAQVWRVARRTARSFVLYCRDEWIGYFLAQLFGYDQIVWESHEARYTFAARRLLTHCQYVIVISEGIKEFYIKNGVAADRLLVAHDGIDESFFDTQPSKEDMRTTLGLPHNKSIVMYIGGFDTWKGVETFFAASQYSDALFVVIGGTAEQVATYKQQFPNVLFLGARPYRELAANQRAADMLVIPNTARTELSARYTSPLKLFAHLTAQRPLLLSDIPSLRAVVSEAHAYFFAPDSPEALAHAVREVQQHQEDAVDRAQQAYELAKQYTWKRRAESIINFAQLN